MTNAFLALMLLVAGGIAALVGLGALAEAPRATLRDWLREMTVPGWLWLAGAMIVMAWAAALIR